MGQPAGIQQAVRRRKQEQFEEQEAQCGERHRGARGARRRANLVEEGTGRLRSPAEGDPEARQRGDVLRTKRDLPESTAAHLHDHGSTEIRGCPHEHGDHREGRDHALLRVHGPIEMRGPGGLPPVDLQKWTTS